MAVATATVDVRARQDGETESPLWLGVVVFGRQANALLRHGKGDVVSVASRVQRRTYTDCQGEAREQLQVVADAVFIARTVRPAMLVGVMKARECQPRQRADRHRLRARRSPSMIRSRSDIARDGEPAYVEAW